ncbi:MULTISPECIES: NAD-dependent epimerase/dehydratase family protein [unclassified Streptomyces]|uniref:NAD-dependent epimerase/dehydratase family protein n=1 Tax=unclassified Streptomyces TaxID=2593676 RepID=UPI001BEA08EC|nr:MULTISPECIES: NAD-dependent epimerase/dehydratase family protein [unclassified Streptomyces]MBT2408706.1 NAD-dependent epimerase/dehydratase family protein [Streptomyces sp. ISL-21]MBT2612054.1 NAD-dependent epimerase/dehydratase family protein [Streptomyces sp. ISL-87]
MAEHVVIGAGATGIATARQLADSGKRVRLITRSGSGPEHPGIERIALDAGRTDELAAALARATTVFNAAMTAYHTWPETMPPLFASILAATERAGADYVILGNHYGYQQTTGAVTERTPMAPHTRKGRVRAELWRQAKNAHDEGRLRVTEVRAGQYLGPGAVSAFTLLVAPRVLDGELALVHGNPDAAHSFSYTEDVAAALVAVGADERAWGRAWHAPVITTTLRQAATDLAELHGAPEPRLEPLTERDMTLLSFTDPLWREFAEMSYMSERPFLVDDSDIRDTFGLKPSTLHEALAA